MFERNIIRELKKWSARKNRKPLVLRGARQVGKTTSVNQFAQRFRHYIYLNLELKSDREPFESFSDINTLVQNLFFLKNIAFSEKENTLIFIDEIQELPEAFNTLRYFYEQFPEVHIIAAGSLLETIFNEKMRFPVGRVEFLVVRPVSFPEFLEAIGETEALKQLNQIPLKNFAYEKLLRLFHAYALIGGMPEIVQTYAQSKDLTSLIPLYDGLISTYIDDIEKYAKSGAQVNIIRHTIRVGFKEAGKRIKFHGFGNSNYGSREIGEALRTLEKTMLLSLVYPVTSVKIPLMPDYKKSPRLQVLDTGIMNYMLQVQKEIIGTDDLNNVYQGTVIEHLVGQEILASKFDALSALHFWVREKKTSDAEVDFVIPFNGKLIPIEVKSGKEGKLKSLHLFMDESPQAMAVRFYAGKINSSEVTTPSGKVYHLLNLPYFLASKLQEYLEWYSK
jgi:predicted AAA+ superfamily ATPase